MNFPLAGAVFAFCAGSGVQGVIFLGLGFVVAARGGSPGCSFLYLFLDGLLPFFVSVAAVEFPIGWGGLCVLRWIGVQEVIFLGLGFVVAERGGFPGCSFLYLFLGGLLLFLFWLPRVNFPLVGVVFAFGAGSGCRRLFS